MGLCPPGHFPEFSRHALPDPLFRIKSFPSPSWNSASLFGMLRNTGPRQTAKRRYLDRLLQKDANIALQETRGIAADLAFLPDSHRYYRTFSNEHREESRAGGSIPAVRRTMVEAASEVRVVVHQRGRILTVSMLFDFWEHITADHINPARTLGVQKQALTMLHTRLARDRCVPSFSWGIEALCM